MIQKTFTLILIMVISISLQAQDKTINKSFSGIKEIQINSSSSDCQIVKGNSDKVDVNLVYSYDDDIFEAVFEQNGSKLLIKEKFKNKANSRGSGKWT
jgi:hypothetical protein